MMANMKATVDCVICGSCVVDLLVRPVPLDTAIGRGKLLPCEPIRVTTGGIVANAGMAMARLGMNVAAFSALGEDAWADVIRTRCKAEGIDTHDLLTRPDAATSTTAVLIDPSGERSFVHCVGAPRTMTDTNFRDHRELFARSRMMLLGYYSLMPNLEKDLARVFAEIRQVGCQTALDAAGDGGSMRPLDEILPHLDVYVPSYAEASRQTGETDPESIINCFRRCGAPGILGVKLGADGALLSSAEGQYLAVDAVDPPGAVRDTTGAGDAFYAGLLTGLLKGMPLADAGRLAAATGACCVTGLGASEGLKNFQDTARLAGLVDA